jgi:hypothetical protein
VASAYFQKHGELPSALTEAVIADVFGSREPSNPAFLFLRSPVSGRYPRLDAKEFSPGDIYMRPLNEAEIQHFCRHENLLNDVAGRGRVLGESGEEFAARLLGRVFYFRMYGFDGVIDNSLEYSFVLNQ